MLSYHCRPGQYPDPVGHRLCGADGDWSPMRSASGRWVSQAKCRGELLAGNVLPAPQHYLPIAILIALIPFRHFVSGSAAVGSWGYLAQEPVVSGR